MFHNDFFQIRLKKMQDLFKQSEFFQTSIACISMVSVIESINMHLSSRRDISDQYKQRDIYALELSILPRLKVFCHDYKYSESCKLLS